MDRPGEAVPVIQEVAGAGPAIERRSVMPPVSMAKRKSDSSAKVRSTPRTRTPGQKVAAKLVKQGGPDGIYIGPWLLFRRVAGANDTKHAIGWIRETIAAAVDAELTAPKRGRHNQPLQRTGRATRSV
jgi:hypothetical protein